MSALVASLASVQPGVENADRIIETVGMADGTRA